MDNIREVARQAALAKAREIIGEDVIDEREVRQVADAAAVGVLTALKQDAYENGRLMAACIEKRLAAFTPAEPPQQEKRVTCALCRGQGRVAEEVCNYCNGSGLAPAEPQTPEPEISYVGRAAYIQRMEDLVAGLPEPAPFYKAFAEATDALIVAVRAEERERHNETVIAIEGDGIPADSVADGFSYEAALVRRKLAAVRAEAQREAFEAGWDAAMEDTRRWQPFTKAVAAYLTRQAGQKEPALNG